MHLLIPFAFCSSDGCAPVLPTLQLPHLQKLLSRLTPEPLDAGDEFTLSPPHERALARALGLPVLDGLLPWAALEATKNPAAHRLGAWAFITPCHWQVGTHHIAMSGQALPDFSAQESQTLLAAMKPYFEEDGITLLYDNPNRWLACGDVFKDLPTASLDRVVGRNVENWMPRSPAAAPLRRLQNEMQMLLYTHPVNDARSARGVLPVNSFWLSGTGALPQPQAPTATPKPIVANSLRDAALNEDWAAWAKAWQTLDATECAALLAALDHPPRNANPDVSAVTLTLCGERSAQTFTARPRPLLKRFMSLFGSQPPYNLLKQL
ncbi:MAG: phosphoglycerate mutase [Rhodoferax sp.]|uniref:phosphoglycerate mutase n=1 Tax=Rhodoferax sp. TaxID=50421 RepID=UPI00301739CB